MADMYKNNINSMNSGNLDDIKSRVQSTVGQVSERVSGVAHNVAGRFQGNRDVLTYLGVGLLVIGAGFGIWSLLRERTDLISGSSDLDYGSDDLQRSGTGSQY